MKIGTKIYIEELEQFGEVTGIMHGRPIAASIKTIDGEKIIEITTLTIRVVTLLAKIFSLVKRIF